MNILNEIKVLKKFTEKLKKNSLKLYFDKRDKNLFSVNLPKLIFLINQLTEIPKAKRVFLREKIRWNLNRIIFSMYLKTAPRYLQNNNKVIADHISQSWTLEYYRIDPVLSKLNKLIKNQTILDPFAGSGNDMNLIASFCKPKNIICSDISYMGGKYIPETKYFYYPKLNRNEIDKIYNNLPDYYRPHLARIIKKYKVADAINLPYKNEHFDWIVTHPPFGINYKPGGVEYLLTFLPELLRVSSKGIIFSAIVNWIKIIKKHYKNVIDLTGDVTKGNSKYPSCFLMIKK